MVAFRLFDTDDPNHKLLWARRDELDGYHHPALVELFRAAATVRGYRLAAPTIYLRGLYTWEETLGVETVAAEHWDHDGLCAEVERKDG